MRNDGNRNLAAAEEQEKLDADFEAALREIGVDPAFPSLLIDRGPRRDIGRDRGNN